MKSLLIYLLLAVALLGSNGFCKERTFERDQSPNLSLNPQDVPLFYDNNPLTGLKAFNVITSFPLKEIDVRKRIRQSIEEALNGVGEVIHLKDNDMRGFGAGNVLLIQMGDIIAFDGTQLPLSRVSLSVETAVSIDKTGMKTFPMVWSINNFIEGKVNPSSGASLHKAVQKLIDDFVQSYEIANREQPKRAVFYIYD